MPRNKRNRNSQRTDRSDRSSDQRANANNTAARPSDTRNPHSEELNPLIIFGRNAVMEGLKSGRSVDKVFLQESDHQEGSSAKILTLAKDLGVQVKFVSSDKLNQMTNYGKHQGVVAYMAAHDYVALEVLFDRAADRDEHPFFIILDQIEDPHNLGAIIRTANVVGAHGVIIPKNRAVSLTATVAKTSAGAIEYTPVCRVTNLARTIEEIKERGVWVTGADMDGSSMYDVDLKGSVALVIGSEGKGLSRLVREKCDHIASIPMKGDINSLNASVAAGVLMYEALRQRV